jgi:hypothetical protein
MLSIVKIDGRAGVRPRNSSLYKLAAVLPINPARPSKLDPVGRCGLRKLQLASAHPALPTRKMRLPSGLVGRFGRGPCEFGLRHFDQLGLMSAPACITTTGANFSLLLNYQKKSNQNDNTPVAG